jgi:hypothetical protein
MRYRDENPRDPRDFGSGNQHPNWPDWMRQEQNPRQGIGGDWHPHPHPHSHQEAHEWQRRDEGYLHAWERRPDIYARSEGEQWRGRFFGRGPKGYRRSDERIREEICDRLMTHPDVDASEVDVIVAAGIVTLVGAVDDRHQKRIAEYIAEDALGVDDVQNDLKVRHGFWASVTGERAMEHQIHRDADRSVARDVDRDVGRPSSVSAREESARAAARRDSEAR